MESITLDVKGMSCGGCVNSVKRVLSPIEGVASVDVVLESGKVTLHYEPAQAQPDQFRAAIRAAGYDVLN